MGSRTFDGVRFAAYTDDHLPPHVHGTISDVTLIIDLLGDGAIRQADRKNAVQPANAPKNIQSKIRRVAAENVEQLVALWEKTHGTR